jgi:hypothetical protein
MAQIDPNIALGFRMPQIQDPLAATARAQEIGVNALKMNEMQRSIAQENKLRELMSSGADLNSPETIRQMYSISPKVGAEFEKGRATIQKEKFGAQKMESEAVDSRLKLSRQLLDGISTPEQYVAWHEANHRDPVLGPLLAARGITADQSRQKIMSALSQPGGLQQLINESKMGVEKFAEQNTISAAQKAQMGVTMRGQDIADARAREGQRMQYDPQLQANIAEAKASGEFIGKNRATAAAALPGAIQSADEGIRLIDEMIGKAPVVKGGKVIEKGTAPHPGFSSYVGVTLVPGQRFIEGSPTASFEVRQKQIEGKAFLEAFNILRGAGAITEKEGEKGTAAIMRMNKAASEKEYIAAGRELQEVLRAGKERSQAKAGGASAAPSGGVIDFNSLK